MVPLLRPRRPIRQPALAGRSRRTRRWRPDGPRPLEDRTLLSTFFAESFDGVVAPALPAGWTTTSTATPPAPWWTTTAASDTGPNSAFVGDPHPFFPSDNQLISPSIGLPSLPTQLTFRHRYHLEPPNNIGGEPGGDVGVLEISIDGGAFQDIQAAGGAFVAGAYNGMIGGGHGNPLGARKGWVGNSGGFVTTTVNLPASAAGKFVQLRWREGTDLGNAGDPSAVGWFVDSIALTQPDVAPVVQIVGAPTSSPEGTLISFPGFNLKDPNAGESFTISWSVSKNGVLFATGSDFGFSFTPDDNGTYVVSLKVIDSTELTDSDSETIIVTNVAPTVAAGDDVAIDEGSTFAGAGLFTDPGSADTWTATVDYGDGSGAQALALNPDKSFQLAHAYADDGSYTVTVIVTDDDGEIGADSLIVTVVNVAPTITALAATPAIDEDGIATVTGTFADPGAVDVHTVTVDWGEGSPEVVTLPVGQRSFTLTHQYLDDNPSGTAADLYAITVSVADDDDGIDSASASVTVQNVAPVITAFATSSPDCGGTREGEAVTISASFADVGTQDTHVAIVDWGDGSTPQVVPVIESGGAGTVSGSHVYASGGIFTATITLIDDDTGRATGAAPAVVTGAGVLNGVLQIVGTDDDDHVTVNAQGKGTLKVHSNFFAAPHKTFSAGAIHSILVVLCDGRDHATIAGSVALPAVLVGGEGDDHLNAGGGSSILLGGCGDDMLVGGNARDLLIGGAGRDRLVGGPDEDILIGGSTVYDGTSATDIDLEALQAILEEWNAADQHATRVARIRAGFLRGSRTIRLGDGHVIDDLAADVLTGSSGRDWFLRGTGDVATDLGTTDSDG